MNLILFCNHNQPQKCIPGAALWQKMHYQYRKIYLKDRYFGIVFIIPHSVKYQLKAGNKELSYISQIRKYYDVLNGNYSKW